MKLRSDTLKETVSTIFLIITVMIRLWIILADMLGRSQSVAHPTNQGEPEAAFMRIIQIRNPALHIVWNAGLFWKKAAATYSPAGRSTIGADGLNFSVRNGKRWSPVTIAT